MSETEFQSELIADIKHRAQRHTIQYVYPSVVDAVLRESGHAELVAALKQLHARWSNHTDDDLHRETEQGNGLAPIVLRARAALRKASAL